MVKFKFYLETPRGGHYNTHYAKTTQRAKDTLEQWNKEFGDTGYKVHLVNIKETSIKNAPERYTVW